MIKTRKQRGKAPGKYYRKGLSWVEFTRRFPDDETAEKWFCCVPLAQWSPLS